MSLTGKVDDKAIADEIATQDEDDEAAITLVRIKSISVANQASNSKPATISEEHPLQRSLDESAPLIQGEESSEPTHAKNENDRYSQTDLTRPSRISLQEEPFHKSRVPRKSVLKHHNHPIARVPSTYDSTTNPSSPPSSPSVNSSTGSNGGTRSPQQQERKCCVIM